MMRKKRRMRWAGMRSMMRMTWVLGSISRGMVGAPRISLAERDIGKGGEGVTTRTKVCLLLHDRVAYMYYMIAYRIQHPIYYICAVCM